MQRVTSAHNPRLREAGRLFASARDRRKAGKCVLEGEHLIAVYAAEIGSPEVLIVAEDALDRPGLRTLAARLDPVTLVVPTRLFGEFAALPAGVGAVAVIRTPAPRAEGARGFCVLLEDVQDPGNVGTILRTAAAAGVDRVLLSRHCAFAWSPKVLRAAQGAHFLLAIEEDVDVAAHARSFADSGGQVIGTVASGGTSLYACDLTGRVALVIGNEGSGLSPALLDVVSKRVTIPMPGGMESLNASVAAAVCLYECVRQRLARRGPG